MRKDFEETINETIAFWLLGFLLFFIGIAVFDLLGTEPQKSWLIDIFEEVSKISIGFLCGYWKKTRTSKEAEE